MDEKADPDNTGPRCQSQTDNNKRDKMGGGGWFYVPRVRCYLRFAPLICH
jgi:hypothetical protein